MAKSLPSKTRCPSCGSAQEPAVWTGAYGYRVCRECHVVHKPEDRE